MYSPIQCQWLLRLPRQATHILINWDYRLNNLEKNGLSLREKPWYVSFKLQEKVLTLFSVNIHPRQLWVVAAFLLFPTTMPNPSTRLQTMTHSEMPISNIIFSLKSFFIPPSAPGRTHCTLFADPAPLYSESYSYTNIIGFMSYMVSCGWLHLFPSLWPFSQLWALKGHKWCLITHHGDHLASSAQLSSMYGWEGCNYTTLWGTIHILRYMKGNFQNSAPRISFLSTYLVYKRCSSSSC